MFAIYKKELKQYFHSMIGFVFLAFFLAIIGIYTWANNFYGAIGNFEITLGASNFLFVLLIPILTMRIVAEENHQGTAQLLYTSPISIAKVILGKYFAVMTLFGIGVLAISVYPLILNHYGTDVQLAMSYSAIIGYFLLGAAYIAIGTFISSLTESQPIAAVVSFIVLLLTYLMTSLSGALPSDKLSQAVILSVLWLVVVLVSYNMMHNLTVSLVLAVIGEAAIWIVYALKSSVYDSLVTKILNSAAIASRFDDFTLGIIQYDAIVYYISIAFLFVFLTIQMIKKKRFS
ncbi:MAG: ABC transporter permease [Lachnospiraceae bacterium]|nr:ABC transporter permease [Lachnospiraceae bacterium]